MENPIVVPFDLNTARKIKSGEIEGSVLINNIEIEFVYESKDCAGPYNLLFVRKDEYGISAIYANTEGCALGDTTLELRVEAGAYFRWDWRRYTLSKESVDKITEFVDTILKS